MKRNYRSEIFDEIGTAINPQDAQYSTHLDLKSTFVDKHADNLLHLPTAHLRFTGLMRERSPITDVLHQITFAHLFEPAKP